MNMQGYIIPIAALTCALGATAQPPAQVQLRREIHTFERAVPSLPAGQAPVIEFIASEFSWDDKPVKNAPYSAEAVTETTQTLADGNRIARKSTAQVYRDGEGRTRREMTLDGLGPWAAEQPHKTIFINDPVAGVHYVLEPDNKIARKMVLPQGIPGVSGGAFAVGASGGNVAFARRRVGAPAAGVGIVRLEPTGPAQSRTETLTRQVIEGVQADGTRIVTVIPAGQIGNEREIEIVSERWYSPELQTVVMCRRNLQTVVMSRRNDPRSGETVYRLTNLRLGEPPRELFEPPADYAVQEGGDHIRIMRRDERRKNRRRG
jgi:hypothetical protein